MNSKIKRSALVLFSLLIAFVFISQAVSDEPRKIPGITDTDLNPKGCVSCHKDYPTEKFDARLSVMLTAWNDKVTPTTLTKVQAIAPDGVTLKGKHTFKVDAETSIPEACNKCHGKMKTALPMSNLSHAIHLTGGKDNKFLTLFNGECTHCHKLDTKTATMTIINGKESEVVK